MWSTASPPVGASVRTGRAARRTPTGARAGAGSCRRRATSGVRSHPTHSAAARSTSSPLACGRPRRSRAGWRRTARGHPRPDAAPTTRPPLGSPRRASTRRTSATRHGARTSSWFDPPSLAIRNRTSNRAITHRERRRLEPAARPRAVAARRGPPRRPWRGAPSGGRCCGRAVARAVAARSGVAQPARDPRRGPERPTPRCSRGRARVELGGGPAAAPRRRLQPAPARAPAGVRPAARRGSASPRPTDPDAIDHLLARGLAWWRRRTGSRAGPARSNGPAEARAALRSRASSRLRSCMR